MQRRLALTIRADNVSALTVASQLKAKRNRTPIAKELSLLYSESSFDPAFFTHVPGVTNTISDSLSRLSDPTGNYAAPALLANVSRTTVPSRDDGYFNSLRFREARGDTGVVF